MSLYADFIKEREGFDSIETGKWFVTFKQYGDELYARDIYVLPEARGEKTAFQVGELLIRLARGLCCNKFTTSVWECDPNKERSISMLERFGMKYRDKQDDLLFFYKDL